MSEIVPVSDQTKVEPEEEEVSLMQVIYSVLSIFLLITVLLYLLNNRITSFVRFAWVEMCMKGTRSCFVTSAMLLCIKDVMEWMRFRKDNGRSIPNMCLTFSFCSSVCLFLSDLSFVIGFATPVRLAWIQVQQCAKCVRSWEVLISPLTRRGNGHIRSVVSGFLKYMFHSKRTANLPWI